MNRLFTRGLVAVAGVTCLSASGFGASFLFSFTDNAASITSSGNLVSTVVGLNEWAISGSITIASSNSGVTGVQSGTYALVANPNAPGTTQFGSFIFDNLINVSPMKLNANGLLFSDGTNYINIWSNSNNPTDYTIMSGPISGGYNRDNRGSFTMNAVPEPFTMGLGLAAAGVFVRRRIKAKTA